MLDDMGRRILRQYQAEPEMTVADLAERCGLTQATCWRRLEAMRAAGFALKDTPELGDVITGDHPGRSFESDVTIADLTGTGAQDTAIATHVLSTMGAAGTVIST